MKRNFLKLFGVACLCVLAVSCSNPSKMAKLASQVKTECNPQVLESVGGKIAATYTVNFPAKYFLSEAILEVTPVLVYGSNEKEGPVFTLQGDKVMDNYQVISRENGGSASQSVVFDYAPGVEKAELILKATVYNAKRTKSIKFPITYKLADGTNCTAMLVKTQGVPSFEADNYQKIIKETNEAQVLYNINRSEVRNSELKSDNIKDFQQYLKDTKADERRTIVSHDIIAYASPDGAEDLNARLSEDRAKSAETAFVKVITKKVDVKDIPMNVSQISEDWEGFQELVKASDIEDKELILRVLSMYSDPEVREREIKNMSSVFKTLADEVLPALRRARFVANVEYKNWTDEELIQIINDNMDQLDEEALLYGATLFDKQENKVEIYKAAASKFNSSRAYNNLAAISLRMGKTGDAKSYLNKMSEQTASYYNNMAVVEMQKENFDAAMEYLAKAGDLKEARYNMGAIQIVKGDYASAVASLEGEAGFNEALANILTNNLSKASSILGNSACCCKSYLKAIIAARQGDAATAKEMLKKAQQKENLAKRAQTDIEFAKL